MSLFHRHEQISPIIPGEIRRALLQRQELQVVLDGTHYMRNVHVVDSVNEWLQAQWEVINPSAETIIARVNQEESKKQTIQERAEQYEETLVKLQNAVNRLQDPLPSADGNVSVMMQIRRKDSVEAIVSSPSNVSLTFSTVEMFPAPIDITISRENEPPIVIENRDVASIQVFKITK